MLSGGVWLRLPHVTTVEGGPSSTVSSGFVESLFSFPHPT
jgi:hypothetical protein